MTNLRELYRDLVKYRYYLTVLLLCIVNLLFMHYYFRASYRDGSEYLIYSYHWLTNFMMTIFDVTLLSGIFLFISGNRLRLSISLTFIVTWVWSISNVVYGRFFYQYIPLSAISEAFSITDGMVLKSTLTGFRLIDLFYILSLVVFLITYKNCLPKKVNKSIYACHAGILFMSFISVYFIYTAYHLVNPTSRYNWELYKLRMKNDIYNIMPLKDTFPNVIRFQYGCSLVLFSEVYDDLKSKDISSEERIRIALKASASNITNQSEKPSSIRNVIFILLESYLSAPIGLQVDNKQITPNLNALLNDTLVYYNSRVKPNITIGESGDGQFIYTTGILPLRSKVTVGITRNNKLPGLPKMLKDQFGIEKTEIIIPGLPTVWRQNEMNKAYGIDHLLSASQFFNKENVSDKDIFDMAIQSETTNESPFFSMILSCSTHMPYNSDIDETFTIQNKTLPDAYKHYLNACHFADFQIGRYLSFLKDKGLYEKSLIIIAADHHAHLNLLGMEGRITNHLPLFIINGNIDNAKAWRGEMNQIDVYTTILDILGIKSKWYGLGNSILSSNYKDPITEDAWDTSESIIEGDYFSSIPEN